MSVKLTKDEAFDLLNTMFGELWDGAADFLEVIMGVLQMTEGFTNYDITTRHDGIDLTWVQAHDAWWTAREALRWRDEHGLPKREEVLRIMLRAEEDQDLDEDEENLYLDAYEEATDEP